MQEIELYLASASPRRLDLLRQAGFDPNRIPSDVDEGPRAGETAESVVLRLAEAKARRGVECLPATAGRGVVLGADTAVVIRDRILGKPRDASEAAAMLSRLSGQEHRVLTGVFAVRTDDGRAFGEVCSTRVRFRHLEPETIRAYVATGEPLDKAGGYAIQGRACLFAEALSGSWTNVVGLPLERIPEVMDRVGVPLRALLRY